MIFRKRDSNLTHHLSQLAAGLPEVRWLALSDTNGMICGCWPALKDEDRLSAMAAAAISFGERIANEMKLGSLCYSLIAGELGQQIVIGLMPKKMLVIGMRPKASLDKLLGALQHSLPLMSTDLGIQLSEDWKLVE